LFDKSRSIFTGISGISENRISRYLPVFFPKREKKPWAVCSWRRVAAGAGDLGGARGVLRPVVTEMSMRSATRMQQTETRAATGFAMLIG
jgi:hypothetical protein